MPTKRTITDQKALDLLAQGLSTPEWSVSFLEDIAEIVAATGRDLDQTDENVWWESH